MLAPPRNGGSLASRYLAPTTCHATHALTGAACVLAACNVRDSIASEIANAGGADLAHRVIEHPGWEDGGPLRSRRARRRRPPRIASASVVTTARPLFTGTAFVRDRMPHRRAKPEQLS